MSLLAIEQLSISFPGQARPAVDRVSFTIEPGEMLALVGESGSGKSLTALAILQLLPPQAHWHCEHITLSGENIHSLPEARLRGLRGDDVGMIFQEPLSALNPLHTVEKQVGESLIIHQGLSRQLARARTLELLTKVQLPEPEQMLGRYPHQLSGGQRQRVMIAMALANSPRLLIADEPTTALDVTVQASIMALLKQLQQEMNLAILFISHDIGLVKRHADKVAVMQQGQIVENGLVSEVLTRPVHPYTRRLLDSEPAGKAPEISAAHDMLLETHSLCVNFKTQGGSWLHPHYFNAVKSVDLTLRTGETLGVVGESGSGKSTLALAILRLLKSEGSIRFAGQPIDQLTGKPLKKLRSQLQVVFQDPFGSLNPHMTVEQIIGEGLTVHQPHLSADLRQQLVANQLAEVGLSADIQYRYPHEFSGGQRQRIALARALILRPQLLILDEPTSALDRSIQFQILALLKQLQQDHGLSYLFISHDLKVVRSISHRLLVMKNGVIAETGETEAIFEAPHHPYTKDLMKAAYL